MSDARAPMATDDGTSRLRAGSRPELIATAVFFGAGAIVYVGLLVPSLAVIANPIVAGLAAVIDGPLRIAPSNELKLAFAVLGVAAVLALGVLERRAARHGRAPIAAVAALREGFAVLALAAQVYFIGFAVLAEPVYLIVALGLALVASRLVVRLVPHAPETPADARTVLGAPLFAAFVIAAMGIALASVHVAAPIVHRAGAAMAYLSSFAELPYRVLMILIFFAPVLFFVSRVPRDRATAYLLALPLVLAPAFVGTTTRITAYAGGACAIVSIAAAARLCGHAPFRWLSPRPSEAVARLAVVALVAANAMAVHHTGLVFNCGRVWLRWEGMRRLNTQAGAFDMATTRDGKTLLTRIRDEGVLASVDRDSGTVRRVIDFSEGTRDSGNPLSWVTPEDLVPIAGASERFLLLETVSGDRARDRVIVVAPDGRREGRLSDLPAARILDMARDGKGRIYVSTAFENRVFVVAESNLHVEDTIEWPRAAPDRIAATGEHLYALGVRNDQYLRAFDPGERREIAATPIGSRAQEMALDARTNRLFVPRPLAGDIVVARTPDLAREDVWPAAFGVRSIAVDELNRLVYVAPHFGGDLRIHDADTGFLRHRIAIGGFAGSIAIDPKTREAFVGCVCGMYRLDPGFFSSRGNLAGTPSPPPPITLSPAPEAPEDVPVPAPSTVEGG
ncbi:hypothetical protein K8I61_08895 [bacterium]|nr:hypothetical protein [bacterium]